MPGQAGAPLGLTLTLVDPMLAAKCCASFTKDPRRRHSGKERFLAGSRGIGLVRSGSVRHRMSRYCGVQDCIHGAAQQDLAV
jgi:hypothetical protein